MATYLTMTTDNTSAQLKKQADGVKKSFDFDGVRRPLRGIEIREDTPAVIKVIDNQGNHLPLFDAGSRMAAQGKNTPDVGRTFCYSNFIIQTAQEMRDEKRQVAETFGDAWVFFYGERPRMINFTGTLLNTLDFNWKQEFWRNYETYLRGTRLAAMNAKIYLYYDQQIIEGYMVGAQAQNIDQQPYHLPFGFSMFVTGYTYLAECLSSASGLYPLGSNVGLQDPTSLYADGDNTKLSWWKNPNALQYQSTLENVRLMSEKAELDGKLSAGLVDAIARGLADMETSIGGFINNVKNAFYGREIIVPAGAYGSEYLAGRRKIANELTTPGTTKRSTPVRSLIMDNEDEYLGGKGSTAAAKLLDDTLDARTKLKTYYALEQATMAKMKAAGLNVTETSKLGKAFSMKGLSGTVTKIGGVIDFAAGFVPMSQIIPHGTETRPEGVEGFNVASGIKESDFADRTKWTKTQYKDEPTTSDTVVGTTKQHTKTRPMEDSMSPAGAPVHPGTPTNPMPDVVASSFPPTQEGTQTKPMQDTTAPAAPPPYQGTVTNPGP